MSRTYHHGQNRDKHLRLRAIRRKEPDFKGLSKLLFELTEAQLEKEAEEAHRRQQKKPRRKRKGRA